MVRGASSSVRTARPGTRALQRHVRAAVPAAELIGGQTCRRVKYQERPSVSMCSIRAATNAPLALCSARASFCASDVLDQSGKCCRLPGKHHTQRSLQPETTCRYPRGCADAAQHGRELCPSAARGCSGCITHRGRIGSPRAPRSSKPSNTDDEAARQEPLALPDPTPTTHPVFHRCTLEARTHLHSWQATPRARQSREDEHKRVSARRPPAHENQRHSPPARFARGAAVSAR